MRQQIFDRLNELTKSYSFLHVIVSIVFRDYVEDIDIRFKRNNLEHLNDKEFSFLIGLWIKNLDLNYKQYSFEEIDKIVLEVYSLMSQLHLTYNNSFDNITYESKNDNSIVVSGGFDGEMFQEVFFYSGSGAYDLQYLKFYSHKYKYDKDWLFLNKKIKLDSMNLFFENIKRKLQFKLNQKRSLKKINTYEGRLDLLTLTYDEVHLNNNDFRNIYKNLFLNVKDFKNINSSFNEIGDFNVFNEKPLLRLLNGKIFIPIAFPISEAIYEAPFYWMNTDKAYSSKALHNRGKVAEEITESILLKIFDSNSIYKNVIINETKVKQITDIDLLVIKDNIGIVFQVKSKKLTSLSKKGNFSSIEKDFKLSVKNSFDQGRISKKCLLEYENYLFLNNNKEFLEKISVLKNVYIVSVLLDDYPGLTSKVNIFYNSTEGDIPLAISIFDLDTLVCFLKNDENFIEYIKMRTKYSSKMIGDNEMSYLGFYLNNGLSKIGNTSDSIILGSDFASYIDTLYYKELYKKEIEYKAKLKPNRNDLCYCLSGKKYKFCHGK